VTGGHFCSGQIFGRHFASTERIRVRAIREQPKTGTLSGGAAFRPDASLARGCRPIKNAGMARRWEPAKRGERVGRGEALAGAV
jgi:hypothetical protein